ATQGGGLFRGDDAERARAAVRSKRHRAKGRRGISPSPHRSVLQRSALRRPSASDSRAGLCFTRRLPRPAADIATAASCPSGLSGTKLSKIVSSRLQNICL